MKYTAKRFFIKNTWKCIKKQKKKQEKRSKKRVKFHTKDLEVMWKKDWKKSKAFYSNWKWTSNSNSIKQYTQMLKKKEER